MPHLPQKRDSDAYVQHAHKLNEWGEERNGWWICIFKKKNNNHKWDHKSMRENTTSFDNWSTKGKLSIRNRFHSWETINDALKGLKALQKWCFHEFHWQQAKPFAFVTVRSSQLREVEVWALTSQSLIARGYLSNRAERLWITGKNFFFSSVFFFSNVLRKKNIKFLMGQNLRISGKSYALIHNSYFSQTLVCVLAPSQKLRILLLGWNFFFFLGGWFDQKGEKRECS